MNGRSTGTERAAAPAALQLSVLDVPSPYLDCGDARRIRLDLNVRLADDPLRETRL